MKRKLFVMILVVHLAVGFMFSAEPKKANNRKDLQPIIEKFLDSGTYIKREFPLIESANYDFKQCIQNIYISEKEIEFVFNNNVHTSYIINRFYFELDENNNLIITEKKISSKQIHLRKKLRIVSS